MAITNADVIARFPEFTDTDTDLIDLAIAEAGRNVDDTWIEDDRDNALKFLTAHILAIGGHGGSGLSGARGVVTSERLGDAATTYADTSDDASGYLSTSYGREFARLRQLSHPPIMTV